MKFTLCIKVADDQDGVHVADCESSIDLVCLMIELNKVNTFYVGAGDYMVSFHRHEKGFTLDFDDCKNTIVQAKFATLLQVLNS